MSDISALPARIDAIPRDSAARTPDAPAAPPGLHAHDLPAGRPVIIHPLVRTR